MRRLLCLLTLAFALATALSATFGAATANAAGLCFGASAVNDQQFVWKSSSTLGSEFDYVRGDATVARVAPCVGNAAYPFASGAWILFANIEDDNGWINQIGYGQGCSLCPFSFVWTPGGKGAGEAWPGKLKPVEGHRIRAVIAPEISGGVTYARFLIKDLTTGVSESFLGRAKWQYDYKRVWWGAEAVDSSSELGSDAGSAYDNNVAYMGYSTEASSSTVFRSGLTSSDIRVNGTKTSNEKALIGTWVYTNDMVAFMSY